MEAKEVIQLLNTKLENVPKAQVRSMGLEVLPRLIDVLHQRRPACSDCKKLHDEGIRHIDQIGALFGDDLAVQKKFESWVDRSQRHLKEYHGMVAKGRTSSVYVVSGIVGGMVIGALSMYMISAENSIGGAVLGFVCGMLIGWIVGKMKESKLRKEQKLY